MGIDFSTVTRIDGMHKGQMPDHAVAEMFEEAANYLRSFDWCLDVTGGYLGMAIPGVIGVFAMKIAPSTTDVDEWLG